MPMLASPPTRPAVDVISRCSRLATTKDRPRDKPNTFTPIVYANSHLRNGDLKGRSPLIGPIWSGGRRSASGDAKHDDLAEVIAVDLQAVAAGRARDDSIRLAPLPRRAGDNRYVAVSTLAAERHAVGPIQLVPTDDDLSGVSRRHQDGGVDAGEPFGLAGEKYRSGPEAVAGQLVSGRVGEVLLRRNRTR